MARHYLLGFILLLSSFLLEALPLNNEETTVLPFEFTTVVEESQNEKERSLMYEEGPNPHGNTREIIEKIKAINDAIGKPHRRQQINWNTQPQTGGSYELDKDVLEKLQEIIASGKLHSDKHQLNLQDDNAVSDTEDSRQSREMFAQLPKNPAMPMPYLTSIPVLVMPTPTQTTLGNNYMQGQSGYQTRQGSEGPSWPFQLPWPFPSLFPIVIRDPFLNALGGGGWNFFEYGQSADICRRQKSTNEESQYNNAFNIKNIEPNESLNAFTALNFRQGRDIKKRTVSHQTHLQDVDNTKKSNKLFSNKKPTTTRKPVKQAPVEHDTKTADEGDLRFGEFTLFGNKRPVVPSPGFFINKLKVRRGGVAIAGPGGVATAGRGGTAIVGPGGLAYTKPGGLAVAGPAARVVALAPDADLNALISRLHEQDGSVPRSLRPILEGKVVATGPVIYYHPNQPFDRGTWNYGRGDGRGTDLYEYDGMNFGRNLLRRNDPMFLLFLKPKAYALSPSGVAIANPISNVVIARNKTGSIVYMPVAAAVAGPGGIAHAQSDLNLYEFVAN